MKSRIEYYPHFPDAFGKMVEIGKLIRSSSLGHNLIHLLNIRISQINGCIFCIDMHVKEAKIDGEKEIRLHHIAGWKESPLFDARERAAFLWAETVTLLSENNVPDAVYEEVRSVFSEQEMVSLTMAVAHMNSWNRIAVSFRAVPGSMDKMYGLDRAGL
ncbi:carboxymuconolactone decarboxylase family protein [Leptospira idonii]|uniref:Carboxymuconolactone decarboxylase family protein n=1 Tax=Leptospira idonii TaxID=1193500 RepID=A0A4R9LYL7_9LEPT|nr:carboxymuconolactone decarboxylase family protein [Leptospira idonii]TGN17691.1 carboxymuconolactone decarboxylase family protein [Leptospira idonii]